MKKHKIICLAIIVIFILVGITYSDKQKNVEDFEIFQSFKMSSKNYERVYLTVIVNIREYNTDEMFYRIRNRYIDLNGEPDVLEIKIYNGKGEWEKCNIHATKVFEKNSIDIPPDKVNGWDLSQNAKMVEYCSL